jgi:hypothetical protein
MLSFDVRLSDTLFDIPNLGFPLAGPSYLDPIYTQRDPAHIKPNLVYIKRGRRPGEGISKGDWLLEVGDWSFHLRNYPLSAARLRSDLVLPCLELSWVSARLCLPLAIDALAAGRWGVRAGQCQSPKFLRRSWHWDAQPGTIGRFNRSLWPAP